jgi:hypothetical protein
MLSAHENSQFIHNHFPLLLFGLALRWLEFELQSARITS